MHDARLITDHRDNAISSAFCKAEGYCPGYRVKLNGTLDYIERATGEADAPGWQPMEGERGEIVAVCIEEEDRGTGETGPLVSCSASFLVLLDRGEGVFVSAEDFAR